MENTTIAGLLIIAIVYVLAWGIVLLFSHGVMLLMKTGHEKRWTLSFWITNCIVCGHFVYSTINFFSR
jgi:hypothetical protein